MQKYVSLLLFFFFLAFRPFAQDSPTPTPQWRPLYHFTPLKNWTNDPNGLIYLDGVFHLYNQQNPFENKWGHMSWGHATSRDLVHWKHLPIAIPETIDQDTTWRFSGCVVIDKNNSSGFCKKPGCLVAIYTADQPNLKKESQFIAYSNDGGITFTNYENNPVIDLHKKDFRDPNVSWNEELKKWLMVVALPTDHKVLFYVSKNLKEWELLSDFGNEGFTGAAWECPSLIRLPVEGSPDRKQKWVLMVSAAGRERGTYMQYYVGEFHGGKFVNDNPAETILTLDYGDCFYAAIPWNNLPDQKKIFIGWMVPGARETDPWRGQMSIPRDLGLKETGQGIRLVQRPAAMIKDRLAKISGKQALFIPAMKIKSGETLMGNQKIAQGNAYWLEAELDVEPGTKAGFLIAQKLDKDNHTVEATQIGYDASANQLFWHNIKDGVVLSGNGKSPQSIDLFQNKGKIKMEILVDKSSLEVFVNQGEAVFTTYIYPDEGAGHLSVFSSGGKATIVSGKIWDLSGVRAE